MIETRVISVNRTPYFLLSNATEEAEIDWNKKEVRTYSSEEIRQRLNFSEDEGFYYIDPDNRKILVDEDNVVKASDGFFTYRYNKILFNTSYFEKANKYLIMFLKYFPLLIIAILGVNFPLSFSKLTSYALGEDISVHEIVDFLKIISYAIAFLIVYIAHNYKMKKFIIAVVFIYILSTFIFDNVFLTIALLKDTLASTFGLWALKEAYLIHKVVNFENFYILKDIRSKEHKFSFKKWAGFGSSVSFLSFSLGGYYMKVLEDEK